MTMLKISDGAGNEAVRVLLGTGPEKTRIKLEYAIAAALTYYAAHPEELPQEMVDAVLADAPRRQMQSLARRVLDRQTEMDRILDEQSKRDT